MGIIDGMRADLEKRAIFEQAKTYAFAYMDEVSERGVFPAQKAIDDLSVFDEPLSDESCDSAEILRLLHEYGSPATVTHTGGRYFGFVIGGSSPVGLAARWLSDVWDQNYALYVISPVAAQLETVCEQWLIDLFGLPAETAAGFVSGTSTATMCGLVAARCQLLSRLGWDVNSKGLFGAPRLRVVLGEQAHASVFRALALLGFGADQAERVPADHQGRMDASRMPELDNRTIVIAQAGNVNSGAFDPLEEICDRANRAGAWIHIDGAFGLWAAASKSKRHLTHGMAKADSWSVDAHKTLNVPYDCGIVLCKRREALVRALQSSGSYILYSDRRDGMQYTLDMSRRAKAVELWATLKFLGRRGVEELVDELCDRTMQFAEELKAEGFHILNDVVFNQILVSCDDPEETRKTLEGIQQSRDCWCGGATWQDRPVIRVSVCSWMTTARDVKRSVAAFVRARQSAARAR
jgi:glutamate/tyrosine decarboxylase-like PLP-dependent enzyme